MTPAAHNPFLLPVKALFFLTFLACSGLSSSPTPPPAVSPPPVSPPSLLLSDDKSLSDRFLVILASKKSPSDPVPALSLLSSHPELSPRQFSSSHFKNLMPCYTVTYAADFATVAEARALSAKLSAMQIDNYVKNAGKWIGPSSAIDAYCSHTAPPTAHDLAVTAGDRSYIRLHLPSSVQESLSSSAPPPRSLGPSFDAWSSPLPIQNVGALSVQDPVELASLLDAKHVTCHVEGFAFLTLGTPHFGVLQQPTPPSAPACGEAAPYARLDCDVSDGYYIQVLPGVSPKPWPLGEEVSSPSIRALLSANSELKAIPESDWNLQFRKAGEGILVEARVETEGGICGGEAFLLAGLFAEDGKEIIPLRRYETGEVVAVTDLEADGAPELLLSLFPDVTQLVGASGAPLVRQEKPFCDCPC